MRVAALYDVHGMPWALEAVLADVGEVDAIVFGGDLLHGPDPAGAVALAQKAGHVFVRGNDPSDQTNVALAHQFALASPFIWPDAIIVPADANAADPGYARTLPCTAINGMIWLRGTLSEAALLRGLQEALHGHEGAGERHRATVLGSV